MLGTKELRLEWPRAVPVVPESASSSSNSTAQSDAAQVAVYMSSMEQAFWQLTQDRGEASAEKAIAEGAWTLMKSDGCEVTDCLAHFRVFRSSSVKRFAFALCQSAIQPPLTALWAKYPHHSVAYAMMRSTGEFGPSCEQARTLKHSFELATVGLSREGLLVQGSSLSGKVSALLAVAVSTAMEASEGIASAEKRMGISQHSRHNIPGNHSLRKDEEVISPLVIVVTPTAVLADQICRSLKRLAAVGTVTVSVQAYHEVEGKRKAWDYVPHHEGRISCLYRQADIAIGTPAALEEMI